jgi:hypothetical protein
MSKNRSKEDGANNDHWETPWWLLNKIKEEFGDYFDPCPLHAEFDGLAIDWKSVNYVNPPYNAKDKFNFIAKAQQEWIWHGRKSIVLVPATTEVRWFHDIVVPNAEVRLIKGRIKFKGTNTKGQLVENKTGQSGSMLIIFGNSPKIIPFEYKD